MITETWHRVTWQENGKPRVVVDEATADHCSHHVPRTACNEHRPTRNEGDPA